MNWKGLVLDAPDVVVFPKGSHPHLSLQVLAVVGESLEKRARARDLRSHRDPENALGGANRENLAKPIRARFC